MEYLRRTVRNFSTMMSDIRKSRTPCEKQDKKKVDVYIGEVYRILIWDEPTTSAIVLGMIHLCLWLIFYYQLRLYGIVFMTLLVFFLADLYLEYTHKLEGRNFSASQQDDLNMLFNSYLHVISLRKNSPSTFSIIAFAIFCALLALSRSLPSFLTNYVIFLAVFFTPLLFSNIPRKWKVYIYNAFEALCRNSDVLAETELIPFISDKGQNDKDSERESMKSDKTSESITTSMISGLSTMPSYMDADGSVDDIDEDDLIPQYSPSNNYTPNEDSSDSDSEQRNMQFDSKYFHSECSSSEEDNYTKGLKFSKSGNDESDSQPPIAQTLSARLMENVAVMGSNLITNILKGGGKGDDTTDGRRKSDSDSNSDFEIVNSDEFNENI